MKRILMAILVIFSVLQAGITFTSGTKVYIGNATLGVYGNITNNLVKEGSGTKLATIDYLSTSKIHFLGSVNDTITNIYTFPNIEISKPSGSVRLNNSTGNFTLTGNLAFTGGNIVTGTNTFELGSTAAVSGESTAGYIVGTTKVARVVGTGSSTFGGIGYSLGTGTGNLGTVTVYRYSGDGSEVALYGSEGIWRKWDVQTSNAFSGTRQVTTSWLSGEDNGNVLSNLKVWKYETAKSSTENTNPGIKKIKIENKTASKILDREIADVVVDEFEEIIVEEEPKTLGWVEVDGAVFNTTGSPRTATYTIDAATQYTINDVSNAFADGSGTASNPYQIATLDQLNSVRYYLSAHFIQIADIDASATSTWNSGAGWVPINNFTGKYNGDGHTVSNLFISRSGSSYIGLFGYTTSGSEIKNLGLENVDFTGGSYTGGFVGYSRGTIKSCFVRGQVKSSTGNMAGGFVGYTTTGNNVYNCYSNATVTRLSGGTNENIAGFCGYHGSGPINMSYSTGSVHYELATDPANKGFAAYSVGTVSGNFWNIETSGQSASYGSSATGLTKAQMRTLSIFTNAAWDFQGESVNGTEDLWGISATENFGYPFLSWEGITHNPSPFAGGIGTSDEPFLVSNLTQLNAVRNFLSYNFLQTADIDASPTLTWDAGAGWDPIGNSASVYFAGNYNGGNNIIINLVINRSTTSYQGLFGYLYNSGYVSNLGVQDASVSGAMYSGILVGRTAGTISNCFTAGDLTTTSYRSGGLTGYLNPGTITDCYAHVDVVRPSGTTTDIGAFIGRHYSGTITNCYSTGTVMIDGSNPGNRGFVGSVGTTYTQENIFWDTESSGQSTSAGLATGKTSAEMKNVATYTSLATVGLTNPWDFVGNPYDDIANSNIWNIHTSLNDGYPYLNWEYRIPVEAPSNLALAVGATDVTITWDAVTGATGYLVYSSADPYGTFILDGTGIFNGTEWTAPLPGTKMFYYVAAVNDTKINENKVIMVKEGRVR